MECSVIKLASVLNGRDEPDWAPHLNQGYFERSEVNACTHNAACQVIVGIQLFGHLRLFSNDQACSKIKTDVGYTICLLQKQCRDEDVWSDKLQPFCLPFPCTVFEVVKACSTILFCLKFPLHLHRGRRKKVEPVSLPPHVTLPHTYPAIISICVIAQLHWEIR